MMIPPSTQDCMRPSETSSAAARAAGCVARASCVAITVKTQASTAVHTRGSGTPCAETGGVFQACRIAIAAYPAAQPGCGPR